MYKIIDKWGMGTMANRTFGTKDEVRDALRSFHSVDVSGAEKMDLDTLLDIGDWELSEVMSYDDMLKSVAKNLNERMDNMIAQDKFDGKKMATREDYILWALEEVCTNDGVIITLEK